MRVLCLHGMGTNSKILEMQTAAIRSHLGEPYANQFEFVDGALEWPAAPGKVGLSGINDRQAFASTGSLLLTRPRIGSKSLGLPTDEYLAWYNTDFPASIIEAIDDLEDYVNSAGPFDGLLGFSQGAVLAALLLARHGHTSPFKFAVFICSGKPFDEAQLKHNIVKFADHAVDKPLIHVPSAHIYGSKDPDADHALGLARMCQQHGRMTYDHGAGHEIPRSPRGVTEEMASVIEMVIAKATIGQ